MSINLPIISLGASQFNVNLNNITFDSLSWIEFLNESPQTLTTSIGGFNFQIPAWYDYPVEVHRLVDGTWVAVNGAQEPVSITPMLLPVLSSNMSNSLLVTLYQKGQVPAITTPQPLFRQGWVPNTVSGTSGTASKLQNDGSTVPTQVAEVTPLGDVNSSFTLRNDAIMTLGTRTGTPGTLNIFGGILAELSVDGSISVGNPGTIQLIGATGVATVQQLVLQVGTLSRMFFGGPFISSTTPTNYSHTLGVVPQFAFYSTQGSATAVRTINFGYPVFTNNTFEATGNTAGFNFFVWLVAV